MKLKGVWGASLVMVALAASSCDQEQAPLSEPTPASARTTRQHIVSEDQKVLILGSSVAGGIDSREAQAAQSWLWQLLPPDVDPQIDVVSPDDWRKMTAEQFMSYRAIIIGDAACQSGTDAFQAAIDTRATWGAVVDGDVAIIASDPTSNNTQGLVDNGVHFAINSVQGRTGMYIALGCAYQDAAPDTVVTLLEPFGTFKVQGLPGCADSGHMFEMLKDDLSFGLYDGILYGDTCLARSVFTSYPDRTFSFGAIAMDSTGNPIPGQKLYTDYTYDPGNPTQFVGTPYIVVRGAMPLGAGCGDGELTSGEECDRSEAGNGQPPRDGQTASQTCSFSCHNNWCGDGHVDPDFGEECDNGEFNGRSPDGDGTIGACTSFCKIPHIPLPPPTDHPPVAVCQDMTVQATNQCGMTADINNGSTDQDGDLAADGCVQSPAGPYGIGDTMVTLTCTDAKGHQDAKTCKVTVTDKVPPVVTLVGPANQSVECTSGGSYTDPGSSARDLCPDGVLPPSATKVTGTVNVAATSVYTLSYQATDPQGNQSATVTRTVTVADTLAPVISGTANVQAECGVIYADTGITANDQCDGNVTAKITKTGTVNTAVIGDYQLKYNVSDKAGHPATQAIRSVFVRDTAKPVVTLNAPTSNTVECGGTFTDPGATANDVCAGTLTTSINSSNLNLNAPAIYIINYKATDPSGNTGISGNRSVTVQDTQAPTLTLLGSANMPLECAATFTDPGATANDACYGNLNSAIVKAGTVNNKLLGTPQTLTYNVKDPKNNAAPQVTRTVTVSDTQAPVITINGSLTPPPVECGSTYTDPGATANDACAGAVAATPVPPVNPNAPGNYDVHYTAKDPTGNTATTTASRAVTVQDTQPPTLTLLGVANSTLECGSPFTEPGATASDLCAGNLTTSIQETGSVDIHVPNTYSLHYTVSDGNSHTASADRTVKVQDTLAPTVSLTGQTTVSVECGDTYADPGATASDACAGTLSAVATSTPNANAPGNYVVSYTATDPSGNVGTSSTSRTVVVQDTQPPTIALNGEATMPLECGATFNDPGATATDHCVGNLTVTPSGGVNNKAPGSYSLTYSADDGHGHSVQTGRTVNVSDTLPPTISVNGATDQTYECGSTYTDPGATANDQCSGDLTSAIVATSSGDTTHQGQFTITYSVTDPAGHQVTSPTVRTVHVNDNTPPTLSLTGPAVQNIECADLYVDPGYTATDACFGDVTGRVTKTGSVNNMAPGSYQLTYNVSDQAGQAAPAVSRTVNVADTKKPVVTINGPLNVPVECGDPAYTEQGATANDACAGVLPAVASTTVNPNAPGNYQVSYSATDPSGNVGTSSGSRTVTVSDTLPPTLALNGDSASTLECGTPYTDPGATASDQCAGNLTAQVSRNGAVNEKVPATYPLQYTVSDGSGHTAMANRSVTVQDTQAPVITVNGPLNDTFACGSTYTDPGATASDVCAGTVPVTSTQTGDPTKPGQIIYTYSAIDPSGNSVTSPVHRTVTVDDHTPPTLALLGSSTQSLECGSPYTDPGATANDACFGDLSASIVRTGSVNNMAPASYQLTYNVTDPAGNSPAAVNRTVTVSDTQAPSITVLGSLSQSVQCGSGPYADPGATANDACAGNLTSAIVTTSSVNSNVAGNYSVRYSVTDPSGNSVISSDVRSVTVVDDLPPTIALNGSANPTLECGTPFSDPGATANDACAGDLTGQISHSGTVNYMVPATYPLHYSVSDPSNHTVTVDRTVTVSDTLPPTLALNGAATQQVECGSSYVDPGATATDVCAGNLDTAVQVSGSVNPAAVGNYSVTYNVSDTAGHAAPAVTRSVTVSDTLPPTIAVNGEIDQTFECGSAYTDPGATASDQCAGNLTSAIVATRSGNTNQQGQFTITYSVTDPAGHQVTSPTVRTVHVTDNAAPTLALNGQALMNLECGTPFVDPGATAQDVCEGNLTASITHSGSVNSGVPSDYTLIYNVADAAGNSPPSVSRTVHVQDTQAPSITVLGPTSATYECGSTYTDPGATATDSCAGNLTAAIVATRTPNPSQPANFTVTYSVTDPSGNTAVSAVSRSVTMNDNQPPSISLNGPATQVLECSRNPYDDPGATATDTCVGSVPVNRTGNVNTQVAGSYVLSYTATDTVGNTSPAVTRNVQITDTVGPDITVTGDIAVTVECKSTYTDLGAKAEDLCSGPATVTTDNPVDTNNTGFYLVKYHATDASGNTNEAVRNVNVTDTQAPSIALNQPNPVQLECGTPYVDPGATAMDACQGDVSSSVFVEFNGVDNKTPRADPYEVRYQARDRFGNTTTLSRDVFVKDTQPPLLTVVGEPDSTIECGVQPDLGVTATDACYGDLTGSIVANPATLPKVPGDYTVSYSVTDPAGNTTHDGASRHFKVVDTGTPVLSVNGYTDLYPEIHYECTGHAIGNVWQNPGATATDACQGDLVVHQYNTGDDDGDGIPGDIDPDDFGPGPTTEVEGLYYVQYLAWDDSFNIQGAILSVYVQDTLKPVLTLNGDEHVLTQCFFPTHDPTKPGDDVEVDPDPYVEQGATGDDQCYGDVSPSVMVFGEVNKQLPGVYNLEYDVRDGAFNWADPVVRAVEVIDNLAPKLTVTAPIKAFPADNSMRTVQLSECTVLWDLCDGYKNIMDYAENLQITSNDPNMDPNDVVLVNNATFQVRVRHNTNNTTRVYTATFTATDGSGNVGAGSCKVYVPMNTNETPPALSSQSDALAGR